MSAGAMTCYGMQEHSPLRFARNVLAEILLRTRLRSLADSAL